MDGDRTHPALDRILAEAEGDGLLDVLADQLSGADLTTLLLEVARRRAAKRTPTDVLAQYDRDRFVSPAGVDPSRLRAVEDVALDAVTPAFTPVVIAPLVPLGTHSVLAGVAQNRVVTTVRSTESAADTTTSLALEAAIRRRDLLAADPRASEIVRLAATSRVTRAQQFDDPHASAHFSLLGLVSAGRDSGNREFETAAMLDHLGALVTIVLDTTPDRVVVRISDFAGRFGPLIEHVAAELGSPPVSVEPWPNRTAGRDYYPDLCFKLNGTWGDEDVELADGGLVDWTQRLLGNRKERLLISGLGLERLLLS
jgi:hypothetical protein